MGGTLRQSLCMICRDHLVGILVRVAHQIPWHYILDGHDKHAATNLKELRHYVMQRICVVVHLLHYKAYMLWPGRSLRVLRVEIRQRLQKLVAVLSFVIDDFTVDESAATSCQEIKILDHCWSEFAHGDVWAFEALAAYWVNSSL